MERLVPKGHAPDIYTERRDHAGPGSPPHGTDAAGQNVGPSTLRAGRLTQISVTQGLEKSGVQGFKIVGAPHMTPYMGSIGP